MRTRLFNAILKKKKKIPDLIICTYIRYTIYGIRHEETKLYTYYLLTKYVGT